MARLLLFLISILFFLVPHNSYAQSLLYFDDFELGLGNWSNVTSGDNEDWTRDSGGTSSLYTGPAAGADGSTYYLYLETSSGYAYTAGDTAILLGPTISGPNIHIAFQYHMYGTDIGTLSIDVLSAGSWIDDVWSVSGQQQTSYSEAYTAVDVDLSAYAVSQIRFRATAAGGYMGDIAIDNIKISSIPSGPVAPAFNSDPLTKSEAIQDQPYNDSIAADAIDMNGDTLEFSKISGPTWLNVASDGTLSGTPDISAIGLNSFEVEVSDGVLTATAVLEIYVNDNSTPILLSSSDFEADSGDWSNVSSGDNKDWTRYSGFTPSSGTGPSSGADGSNYYVYLETSSGSAYTAGDTAILLGPAISAAYIHLIFKYHMYGSNIGTLAVDVLSGGSWIDDVWVVSGQQQTSYSEAYTAVDVDLSAYAVSQIRFRATAAGGYMGDIAIDNIEISSIFSGPVAPAFNSDPLTKSEAIQDQPYNDSIAADAIDRNGDSLEFSKISGPTWLNVASDGTLSGTPDISAIGLNSFEVEVSDGVLTATAVLEIYVNDNSTPILLSSSDFEADSGDWSNVSSGDNKDWTRYSGFTPSSGTGPSSGADGSNYYMYVETSSGGAYTAGDKAILLSPPISASHIHLIFQYHMYGSNIGTLAVDVFDGSAWINNVWSISGQQHTSYSEAYTPVDLDLSAFAVTQLRFRVTAAGGYMGDIAIDAISILSVNPDYYDTDQDGIADNQDPCPGTSAGEPVDANGCSYSQQDEDTDGVANGQDACLNTPSGEAVDSNGCSASQTDTDNDGITDNLDICPSTSAGETVDSNGCSDSQKDSDNDGIFDDVDAFPNDPSEWIDTDNDGTGNNADTDDDGDGFLDTNDDLPLNSTEWLDTDGDGIGNNADMDDDNDGVDDVDDDLPLNAGEVKDTDGDGIGNNADTDDDNDGVSDVNDAFPLDPNETVDTDGDGVGDNSDPAPLDSRLPAYVYDTVIFEFHGSGSYSDFGGSVSGHGDINGDGYADILIGNYVGGVLPNYGCAFAYSGADGTLLHKINGEHSSEFLGKSVEIVSDVNGDGYDDMFIGAPGDCLNDDSNGRATLYSGSDGSVIYSFTGDSADDCFGYDVASAGDVNGDGVADLIVGTESRRYVRIFSGADGSTIQTLQPTTPGEFFGTSVSGAGDVNNDGYADVIAGSIDGRYAEVFSGIDGSSVLTLQNIGDTSYYKGAIVSAAGDTNGDGFGDVAIGQPGSNEYCTYAGQVIVYSGKDGLKLWSVTGTACSEGFGTSLDAADLNHDGIMDILTGTMGSSLAGGRAETLDGSDGSSLANIKLGVGADGFGKAVSVMSDITGDGVPEMIVGAPAAVVGDTGFRGKVYVIGSQRDSDGDGVPDVSDDMPLDASEQKDTDGDGLGNNADTDDDNDGIIDSSDAYPLISIIGHTDTDGDGAPDDCDSSCQTDGMAPDTDDDNDGMPDSFENLYVGLDPLVDDADGDLDGDGISNLDEYLAGTNPSPVELIAYGVTYGGSLYQIDLYTGMTYYVGNLEPQGFFSPSGLAFSPEGILYLVDTVGDSLYSVDIMTGKAKMIGPLSHDINRIGLSFDSAGNLWMVSDDKRLYSINTLTGSATVIGTHGISNLDSLAWDGNTLYGMTSAGGNSVYTIDRTTASATRVGDLINVNLTDGSGMTYQASGALWGLDENGDIFTVDPYTGEATRRSAYAVNISNHYFDAIALIYDTDGDGLPDAWEDLYGLDKINAADGATDVDSDTLSNLQEYHLGTNPLSEDTDSDGVNDDSDNFPKDAAEWLDSDGDGTGNNADGDDDGDGFKDAMDPFPLDSSKPQWLEVTLFDIDGDRTDDRFGISVDGLGDVNADGFDDFIIGSTAEYIKVFSGYDGSIIHRLTGPSYSNFGTVVASVGDLNNDSVNDFAVSAPLFDQVLVYSGIDGAELFNWSGGEQYGNALAAAGDVNNDGVPDIIIGAKYDDTNNKDAGAAEVRSGLDGSVIHSLKGSYESGYFGSAVCGLGDVNGDGYDDFAIKTYCQAYSNLIQVVVFSGKTGGMLWQIQEYYGYAFGQKLKNMGDIDHDGINDLGITHTEGGAAQDGYVSIFSGKTGSFISHKDGEPYSRAGFDLAGVGDFDGDGTNDYLLSLSRASSGKGKAWLISGENSRVIYEFLPQEGDSDYGYGLGYAGDVNNDGRGDFIIGASGTSRVEVVSLLLDSDSDGVDDSQDAFIMDDSRY